MSFRSNPANNVPAGGGGVENKVTIIDGIIPINTGDDVFHASNESTFLRSGVYELDPSVYPEASARGEGLIGEFDIKELSNPTGVCWDGSDYWCIGETTDAAFKYNADGVYQNVSFPLGAEDTAPEGITWDGTDFWMVGLASQSVHKYNSAGVYQGVSFSVAPEVLAPKGITWDGTFFYVIDDNTEDVAVYDAAGVFQSVLFNVLAETNGPKGIEWDGTYFWVAADAGVYKYNAAGVYQDIFVALSGSVQGIGGWNGSTLRLVTSTTDVCLDFATTPFVGMEAAQDSDTGLQIYLRVA